MFSTANTYIERGSAQLGRFLVPQSGPIWIIAAAAAWYGRRVALTYAPGYLADYCIRSSISSMGETMGRVVGATVVAPAMVPSLVPVAAGVTAVAFWYATVLVGNFVHQLFKWIHAQWQARVTLRNTQASEASEQPAQGV